MPCGAGAGLAEHACGCILRPRHAPVERRTTLLDAEEGEEGEDEEGEEDDEGACWWGVAAAGCCEAAAVVAAAAGAGFCRSCCERCDALLSRTVANGKRSARQPLCLLHLMLQFTCRRSRRAAPVPCLLPPPTPLQRPRSTLC